MKKTTPFIISRLLRGLVSGILLLALSGNTTFAQGTIYVTDDLTQEELESALEDLSNTAIVFDCSGYDFNGTIDLPGDWTFVLDPDNNVVPVISANRFVVDNAIFDVAGVTENKIITGQNRFFLLESTANQVDGRFNFVTEDGTVKKVDWGEKFYFHDFLYGVLTRQTADGLTHVFYEQNLTWYQGKDAHGNFTVEEGESFDVNVPLNNITNGTLSQLLQNGSDWDGKTLTKYGAGELILSMKNSYAGATLIREGSLVLGFEDAIGASAGVFVDTGASLVIDSGYAQSVKALTGGGSVVFKNEETLVVDTPSNTLSIFNGTFGGTKGTLVKTGNGILALNALIEPPPPGTSNSPAPGSAISDLEEWYDKMFYFDPNGYLGSIGDIYVQGGTLLINGQFTNTQNVYVEGGTLGGTGSPLSEVFFSNNATHRFYDAETAFAGRTLNYGNGSTIIFNVGKKETSYGTEYVSNLLEGDYGIEFAADGRGTTLLSIINYNEQLDQRSDEELVFTIAVSAFGEIELNGVALDDLTPVISGDGTVLEYSFNGANLVVETNESLRIIDAILSENPTDQLLQWSIVLQATGKVTQLSPNQKTVLHAIDYGPLSAVLNRLSGDAKREALDELIPHVNLALPIVSRRAVSRFNETTFTRLDYIAFRGKSGCAPKIYQLWGEADGEVSHQSSTDELFGYKIKSGGGTVGMEAIVLRDLVLGVDFAGIESRLEMKDPAASSAKARMFLTSVYSMWFHNNWSLKTSVGYGWNEFKTRRPMPLYDDYASGKHRADGFFAAAEIAKRLRFGQTTLTPFYKFEFQKLWEKGYEEESQYDAGAPYDLALNYNKRETDAYLQTVGVRLGRDFFTNSGMVFSPTIYAGWIHEYGKSRIPTIASGASFLPFTVYGDSPVRDRGLIGLGIEFRPWENWVIFGRYEAELAESFDAQLGNVGLGLLW